MSLYKKAVKLAYDRLELRPHLLPLLKKAFTFGSADLQRLLDQSSKWKLRVDSFRISKKLGFYVVSGEVVTDEQISPRDFFRDVMNALHQASFRLPGEVSVKAKPVSSLKVRFFLEGKGT